MEASIKREHKKSVAFISLYYAYKIKCQMSRKICETPGLIKGGVWGVGGVRLVEKIILPRAITADEEACKGSRLDIDFQSTLA